eukprot:TRINITY_DN1211_c5_g1_i1.p1 TRINITY_DN1211_c5_g1~~TRINITY_DN1211_c5_g1_i1.p1  ORF type:complete len:433 (+),score=131.71 TRINITY_DN1211_c5_g1_i1:59-1357(+)
MKKFIRGAQAVKQKAGVVQGTTDDSYDALDKEINKLHKTAKELPKVIAALTDGLKSMWKSYSKMTNELNKIHGIIELSPLYVEMSRKLEGIGNELEAPHLEKLQADLSESAIDVLRRFESDIKSLDHIREERGKRRLEFDAVREKTSKKEAELKKKGKDIDNDPTIRARRIDVETAMKAYEFSNSRSIEEMTKVCCVKDDVFKMTTYNISVFLGEYLKKSSDMMLGVKAMYESALHGGEIYRKDTTQLPPTPPAPAPSSPIGSPTQQQQQQQEQQQQQQQQQQEAPEVAAPVSAPASSSPEEKKDVKKEEAPRVALGTLPPPLDAAATGSPGSPDVVASPVTVAPLTSGVMGYADSVKVDAVAPANPPKEVNGTIHSDPAPTPAAGDSPVEDKSEPTPPPPAPEEESTPATNGTDTADVEASPEEPQTQVKV